MISNQTIKTKRGKMKAFLSVLAIIGIFSACHHHRHTHKKTRHVHEEHHHYPQEDLSTKSFVIEQDIDLHLDEMPQTERQPIRRD